jgi:hypothetical protein
VSDGRSHCSKLKGLEFKAKMGLSLELDDVSNAAPERCGRTPPRLPFVRDTENFQVNFLSSTMLCVFSYVSCSLVFHPANS